MAFLRASRPRSASWTTRLGVALAVLVLGLGVATAALGGDAARWGAIVATGLLALAILALLLALISGLGRRGERVR